MLREKLTSIFRRNDWKYYDIVKEVDGFNSYVAGEVIKAVSKSLGFAYRYSYPKYASGLPSILILRLEPGEKTSKSYLKALERFGVDTSKITITKFTTLLNMLDKEVSKRLEKDGILPTDAEIYRENRGVVKGGFSAGLSGAVPSVKAGAEAEAEEAVSAKMRGDVDAVRTKVIEVIGELVERLRKGKHLVVIMDAEVEGERRSFIARHLLETGNVTLVVDQDNTRVLRSLTSSTWAREYSIGHTYFDSLNDAEDTVNRFARIVETAIIKANKDILLRAEQILRELPSDIEQKLSISRRDIMAKLRQKYVIAIRGQVIPAYVAALILENFNTEIANIAAKGSYNVDIEPVTLLQGLGGVIYTAILSKENLLHKGSYGSLLSVALPLAVRRMRDGNDYEHKVTRLLAMEILRDSLRGAETDSLKIVPAKDVVVYEDLGIVEGDARNLAERLTTIVSDGARRYAGYLLVRQRKGGGLLIGVLVGHKILGTVEWDGKYFWIHVARVFDLHTFLAGAGKIRIYGIRDPVQVVQGRGRDEYAKVVLGVVKTFSSRIFYSKGTETPGAINRRDILVSQVSAMSGIDRRIAGIIVDALALRRVKLESTISPEMVVEFARVLGYEDVDIEKVIRALVASGLAIPRTRYVARSAVVNYLASGEYEEYIIARRTDIEGVIPSGEVMEKIREYIKKGVEVSPREQKLLMYFSPVLSGEQLRHTIAERHGEGKISSPEVAQ